MLHNTTRANSKPKLPTWTYLFSNSSNLSVSAHLSRVTHNEQPRIPNCHSEKHQDKLIACSSTSHRPTLARRTTLTLFLPNGKSLFSRISSGLSNEQNVSEASRTRKAFNRNVLSNRSATLRRVNFADVTAGVERLRWRNVALLALIKSFHGFQLTCEFLLVTRHTHTHPAPFFGA